MRFFSNLKNHGISIVFDVNRNMTVPFFISLSQVLVESLMRTSTLLDACEVNLETLPSLAATGPSMDTETVMVIDELMMDAQRNLNLIDELNLEREPSLTTDEPCTETSLVSDERPSKATSIHTDEPPVETAHKLNPKAIKTDSATDCEQKYSPHIPQSDATCPTELLSDIYSVLHRNAHYIAGPKTDTDWLTPRQRWELKECEWLTESLVQHLDTEHYMTDEPDYWASQDYLEFWQIELQIECISEQVIGCAYQD